MLTHQQAAAKSGLTETDIYQGSHAALAARKNAKPGQSNFYVGATFMLWLGETINGANWETGADNGMCAEGVALGNLLQLHESFDPTNVSGIFVVGAPKDSEASIECTPCGGCRDRLATFLPPEIPIITIDVKGNVFDVYRLEELHPTFYADKSNLVEKTNIPSYFTDFDIPKADDLGHVYAPYHQGNIEIITCLTTQPVHSSFSGYTGQNASYTLTTNAAGAAMEKWLDEEGGPVKAVIYSLGKDSKAGAGTFQRLREFCKLETPVMLCDENGKPFWVGTLDQALPRSFGPDNLAKKPQPDFGPKP